MVPCDKKKCLIVCQNEIYLTSEFDVNALDTVLGKARVVSVDKLKQKYPSGKIPRSSEDNGKTFVCRRGVTARTATYTDEFIWEDVFHGVDDLRSLAEHVKSETQTTRGHKPDTVLRRKEPKDLDFVVVDDGNKENGPRTPKKRRNIEASTPKSMSKLVTPTSKRQVISTCL